MYQRSLIQRYKKIFIPKHTLGTCHLHIWGQAIRNVKTKLCRHLYWQALNVCWIPTNEATILTSILLQVYQYVLTGCHRKWRQALIFASLHLSQNRFTPRLNSFCLSGKRIKHQVKSNGGESFAFIAKLKLYGMYECNTG